VWDLLTPEERAFKERCRRFAEEVIAPRAAEHDRTAAYPHEVHALAWDAGLMNVGIPRALGGQGLSHRACVVGAEELAAACAPIAFTLGFNHGALQPVLQAGTDAQKERWVRELLARRGYAALCFTEEDRSGSYLMALSTRADRAPGGGWRIRGRKVMTGNGTVASVYFVLAETFEGERRLGLTLFIVPRGPGVVVGDNTRKVGFRCLPTAPIAFEDVEVPAENVIGEVGDAEGVLMRTLDYMRFGGSSVILGIAVASLRAAVPWAEERLVYPGEPLAQKSHVQLLLADLYAEVQSVRHLLWRAASLLDAGRPCSAETSMAKLAASRLAVRATNEVVQLMGWRGIDDRFGMEKRLRDARVTTIYEGTSEIQLLHIWREARRSAHADGWF
jgi:alkylation response protein AidB-like acyl-CoA dehydrogenase